MNKKRGIFMLSFIESINSILWGPIMLVLLLGTGIYYTIVNRFVQVREFVPAIRQVFGGAFKKQSPDEKGELSSFSGFNNFHSCPNRNRKSCWSGNCYCIWWVLLL